jgi:UDP-N-acetyl-D-glucosamine dehydrogenase
MVDKRSDRAISLAEKISDRRASMTVLGLGYVGLPLAVEFANVGLTVTGVDTDVGRVRAVNEGRSYVSDMAAAEIEAVVKQGRLTASSEFSALSQADVVIICVPTPMNKSREPDISHIVLAANKIQQHLHPGELVILESTTYPGTTEEVLLPLFRETGLKLDDDYFLAFSPERIDPGNKQHRLTEIPKIVGGLSPASTQLAGLVYRQIIKRVHEVSSARAAEAAKLLENTFRAVNVALANEFALLCRTLGIDVWEVIEAASTKPFGFMPFYPGPGIGGHCIPVDPNYLTWKARLHGFEPRLIGVAQEINSFMPHYVVDLIAESLNEQMKPVKGSKVLVLGVSYKRNVGDVRESPALFIINELRRHGAIISYVDPYVDRLKTDSFELVAVPLEAETLKAADCVLIATDHDVFDYQLIASHAKLVVDVRNATRALGSKENVTRL